MYVYSQFLVSSHLYIFHHTVLHPRYKTTYWIEAEWPEEWIDAGQDILQLAFAQFYVSNDASEPVLPTSSNIPNASTVSNNLLLY